MNRAAPRTGAFLRGKSPLPVAGISYAAVAYQRPCEHADFDFGNARLVCLAAPLIFD